MQKSRTILAASAAVALTAAAFSAPAVAGPDKKGTTTVAPSAPIPRAAASPICCVCT